MADSIVQQTILNNFANNIKEAIEYVGGDTSDISSLCDFSKVIKGQLIGDLDIKGGDGIEVKKDEFNFTINANSNAILDKDLVYRDTIIPKGITIQETFKRIFDSILPFLPSIQAGDIIISTDEGKDYYTNPNGNSGEVTGLEKSSKYLRIFIVSQDAPIYILLKLLEAQSITNDKIDEIMKDDQIIN